MHSVASFVCSTCEDAKSINVFEEFKIWYEREFELQRQRNCNDAVRRSAIPGPKAPLTVPPAPEVNPADQQQFNRQAARVQQFPPDVSQVNASLHIGGAQEPAMKPLAISPLKMKVAEFVNPPKAISEPTVLPLAAPGIKIPAENATGIPDGRGVDKPGGNVYGCIQTSAGGGRDAAGKK